MKWVRVTHDFGLPVCVLTLSTREAAMHRVRAALTDHEGDPNAIEEALTRVIADVRPELAGGVLTGIDMAGMMTVRFYYWHPKLPRATGCNVPVEIPLYPPVNEPVSRDVPSLVARHSEGMTPEGVRLNQIRIDPVYDPPVFRQFSPGDLDGDE